MTQAAVNNAIVLYRLAVERRDVEEAQRVYFVTEKLAQTLANPLIPLTKKYDIIEKVYGFESEPKLITSFIKEMVKLGYAAEMNEIFEAYYRYWVDAVYCGDSVADVDYLAGLTALGIEVEILYLALDNGDYVCCTDCAHRGHLLVNFLSSSRSFPS